MVSLLGMARGVASLITVLAVLNGFADELRDRILSLVPHLEVQSVSASLDDWPLLAERLLAYRQVRGAAPYIESKVLISSRATVRGSLVTAIDPASEESVSRVSEHMRHGNYYELLNTPYGIIIGSLQARALGVTLGDRVELTVPRLTLTPLGSFPRRKRFTVVGIFEIGAQLDGSQAYISLASGQKLLGLGDAVHGVRVSLDNLFDAPALAQIIQAEQRVEEPFLPLGNSIPQSQVGGRAGKRGKL